MLKHLFITTCSFQKTNNYQALMTSLWRIWIYNMYKPKIIVWLEAWLNHNSVSENLSDGNFFMVQLHSLHKSNCTLKLVIWKSVFLLQKLGGKKAIKFKLVEYSSKQLTSFLQCWKKSGRTCTPAGKNGMLWN